MRLFYRWYLGYIDGTFPPRRRFREPVHSRLRFPDDHNQGGGGAAGGAQGGDGVSSGGDGRRRRSSGWDQQPSQGGGAAGSQAGFFSDGRRREGASGGAPVTAPDAGGPTGAPVPLPLSKSNKTKKDKAVPSFPSDEELFAGFLSDEKDLGAHELAVDPMLDEALASPRGCRDVDILTNGTGGDPLTTADSDGGSLAACDGLGPLLGDDVFGPAFCGPDPFDICGANLVDLEPVSEDRAIVLVGPPPAVGCESKTASPSLIDAPLQSFIAELTTNVPSAVLPSPPAEAEKTTSRRGDGAIAGSADVRKSGRLAAQPTRGLSSMDRARLVLLKKGGISDGDGALAPDELLKYRQLFSKPLPPNFLAAVTKLCQVMAVQRQF